jgi:hypothetical protein
MDREELRMANEAVEIKKCQVEGCKRPYRAKGYCVVHYQKWRRGELGKARYKTCSAEDCLKPTVRWGLCEEHYEAALKKNKSK